MLVPQLEHERAHLMPMPKAFDGYVATTLQVSTPPRADPARYDRLRGQDDTPIDTHGDAQEVGHV